METDPQHYHPALYQPSVIYEVFGLTISKKKSDLERRDAVVSGLHHLVLKRRGLDRFPMLYTLDVLRYSERINKPPQDPDVLRAFARSPEAHDVIQRTEKHFEQSIREALAHESRPEGSLSTAQIASIFDLGTSTMTLLISKRDLEAENIAESLKIPKWSIPEASLREFYAWHRPDGYPEYPEPLRPIS